MTQVCRRRGGIGDDQATFSAGGEKLLGRVGAGAQVEPLVGRGRQAGGSQRKPVPSVSSPRRSCRRLIAIERIEAYQADRAGAAVAGTESSSSAAAGRR